MHELEKLTMQMSKGAAAAIRNYFIPLQ